MLCPMCGEELTLVRYIAKDGHDVNIYTHDNSCPFVGFEFVDNSDLYGLVEHILEK